MPATSASIVALVGLAVSVGVGSWWTAIAARDGMPIMMLVRFTCTVAIGTYYMVWLRNQGHQVPAIRLPRRR
ncbi:MAG: hypothetical protein ACN4GZ_00570 [Acidimicrobiales bacterium]